MWRRVLEWQRILRLRVHKRVHVVRSCVLEVITIMVYKIPGSVAGRCPLVSELELSLLIVGVCHARIILL